MELGQETILNIENTLTKNNFLESSLWKTINNGIDIGMRYLLPDLVEDEIIDLKDNLIDYGLKDGIKKSINTVIETGKEAVGVVTGNYENIGQIQSVIKNGGIIDKISDVLDAVIEKAESAGKINKTISSALKKGTSAILSSIEKNIEATLTEQISGVQLVEKYINNWKEYYEKKDFTGMQQEYNKLTNKLKTLIPIENTLKNARYLENLHNLIKNNGQSFDLSEEELELASKLSI